MEVTTENIKKLRKLSNEKLGLTECRGILTKVGGDVEKAKMILIGKGIEIMVDEKEYTVTLELRKPYTLGELIRLYEQAEMKRRTYNLKKSTKIKVLAPVDEEGTYLDYDYEIYTVEDYPEIHPEMICYLERGCEYDRDDNEYYPEFVTTQKLYQWHLTEIYEGVVGNLLQQKENPTIDDYMIGLKYYLKYDAFYDFGKLYSIDGSRL